MSKNHLNPLTYISIASVPMQGRRKLPKVKWTSFQESVIKESGIEESIDSGIVVSELF